MVIILGNDSKSHINIFEGKLMHIISIINMSKI